MRTAKLCATVCILSFAAMVLGAHESGQLFPWVHGFVFISATTLLVGSFFGRLSTISIAVIAIGIAVALRLFIFEWPPVLIGQDPDKYAVGVIRIIRTGNLFELKQAYAAYGTLSAFHLFNSIVAIVAGFGGENVLVAIPILTGVLFPLSAIIFVSYKTWSSIAIGLSGTIAAIAATGVHFGYFPIVQAIAVLLWCPILIGLSRHFSTGHKRDLVLLSILILAQTFAHKLSLFILVGTVWAATFIKHITPDLLFNIKKGVRDEKTRSDIPWKFWLALTSVGLLVQWVILTVFLKGVIIGKLLPLLSGGLSISSKSGMALAAVTTSSGIIGRFLHIGNFTILLAITAIASLGLWIYDRTWLASLFLGATLTPALIVGISIVGVSIAAPQRATFFGIPIFAAIIGLVMKRIINFRSVPKIIVVLLISLLLIISQAGSITLSPNYPGEPRLYLTSEEVSGKIFMDEYSSGPVAMDHYYRGSQVDLDDPSASQKSGRGGHPEDIIRLREELLNATLMNQSYKTILLRNVKWIQFGGTAYRLTWDPIVVLTTNNDYNRIYDNGPVVGFVNESSIQR